MRQNRGEAMVALFEKLAEGDPITWGVVGALLLIVGGIMLLGWKLVRDARKEDEARAKKYGRKPWPR